MKIIDNIKHLTRSEAAELMGVSSTTLEQWAHKRTGPSYSRLGKWVYYTESSINAYIESIRKGGKNDL